MAHRERDQLLEIHQTWIGYVRPEGVIVAPHVLSDRQVAPETSASVLRDRQEELTLHLDPKTFALKDVPVFLTGFLGWRPSDILGGPGGESLPPDLVEELPEWRETLRPGYAVRSAASTSPEGPWQLVIVVAPPEIDIDLVPTGQEGWPASQEQRFERPLRGTKAFAGLLIGWARDFSKRLRPIIRLVYAPVGETSGYADFDLKAMTETGGRPILAALEMLIGEQRLFNSLPQETLSALLAASRRAQAEVSTKLSQQVLAALYALLARPPRGPAGAHTQPRPRRPSRPLRRPPHVPDAARVPPLRRGPQPDAVGRGRGSRYRRGTLHPALLASRALCDNLSTMPPAIRTRWTSASGRSVASLCSSAWSSAGRITARSNSSAGKGSFSIPNGSLSSRAARAARCSPTLRVFPTARQDHSRQSDQPRRGASFLPHARRRADRSASTSR